MRLKFVLVLAPLALIVILTSACSAGGETPAAAAGGGGRGGGRGDAAGTTVPISTAAVEEKSVPLTINVIGTSEAFHTVAVRAQVTGELTSVRFKEGDDVKEGQVIFELDRRPLEAALQQAQANLARDTAQEANARASAARYQDLLTRGIATREQADQARTAAEALAATLDADRASVDNAKVQLQYATIHAPISGRTGALMVHEGNLVRANDNTPLVIINQVSPIYVSFGIQEGQLPDLKRYMAQGTVRVDASPAGETVSSKGKITFIDNTVDATTGQIKIKAAFPNTDHRLWPGQFANVVVTLKDDPHAIVVPTAAVQAGQTGNYVFVVKDHTADIRNISVERQSGEDTVVKEGLQPGDIVVTDGQVRLVGGSKVSIKSGPGARGAKVEP
jgi:multidrug efflux system membrane fusion protein